MRCLLVGNYGVGNLGDEALCSYMLETFPEIEWNVVSAHPTKDQYDRLPCGIRSFFSMHWLPTVRAIWHADALVLGGGTLFTDIESVRACVLWGLHVFAARIVGVPVYLAFQGIGPFRTMLGRGIWRLVLKAVSAGSVRDEESMQRIPVKLRKKFVQSFDPIITVDQPNERKDTQKLFIVIPRRNSSHSFWEAVQRARRTHQHTPACIVLLQPDDPREQEALERLRHMLGASTACIAARSMHDLVAAVASASCVVTQRFHGAIAALALGVPVSIVPQRAGDKLAALIPYALQQKNCDELFHLVRLGEDHFRSFVQKVTAASEQLTH